MSKLRFSSFLFRTTRSPFLTGMGNQLNMAGNYYLFNYSSSEDEADCLALNSDWSMVGHDIEDAKIDIIRFYNHESEVEEELPNQLELF